MEASKVRLNDVFGAARCSVEEAARMLLSPNILSGVQRLEQLDEFRKVDLGKYEELHLFDYLQRNFTDYAVARIRYQAAIGLNTIEIKK